MLEGFMLDPDWLNVGSKRGPDQRCGVFGGRFGITGFRVWGLGFRMGRGLNV